MNCRKGIVALAALLLWAGGPARANDLSVEAVFDRQEISLDENLNMSIRITGSHQVIKRPPAVPSIAGFTSYYTGRASHFTFSGGASENSTEFNFVLMPKAAGRFTVPSIDVEVNDTVYRTEPILITVLAAGGQTVRQPSGGAPARSMTSQFPAPFVSGSQPTVAAPYVTGEEDEDIFVKAWVNKSTAYPNEPVILTYSIYTRRDTQFEGFEDELVANGFWLEEFPMGRELDRQVVRLEGRKYLRADVKKMALFATAPGALAVQPGSLRVAVEAPGQDSIFDDFFNDPFFSGGFFRRRIPKILTTATIPITVLPFPEAGKPASFTGVVGQYRMTVTADKRVVKENEPVTLTIDIEGEGNLETLERPVLPELKNVQIYETDTRTQLVKQADRVYGRKTFEVVLIPREAGSLELPPLQMPYFDPYRKVYETVRGPAFTFDVKPGEAGERIDRLARAPKREAFAKKVEKEAEGIYTILTDLASLRSRGARNLTSSGLAVLDVLLALLVIGLAVRRRAVLRLEANQPLKRRKLAPHRLRKDLAALAKLARKSGPAEDRRFFEEVHRSFLHYLADRLNLSRQGVTFVQIDEALAGQGRADALRDRVRALSETCERVRFADVAANGERKRECLHVLEEIFRELG